MYSPPQNLLEVGSEARITRPRLLLGEIVVRWFTNVLTRTVLRQNLTLKVYRYPISKIDVLTKGLSYRLI
jgi:hypothetical protein